MRMTTILAGLFLAAAPLSATLAADPDGQALFGQCKSCHQVGKDARNTIGPHLDGLFGRTAGSNEGFSYSKAMKEKGAAGLKWDADALNTFLEKPAAFVPGTRMSYRGLPDAAKREALIAWLQTATASAPSGEAAAAAPDAPEGVGAAAMKLTGDPEYGQYLSGDCVTCHQVTGHADGIPSIVGWPKDAFIRALFEYKTNIRTNEVMKLRVANLGNEEIAALAAYFATLKPE